MGKLLSHNDYFTAVDYVEALSCGLCVKFATINRVPIFVRIHDTLRPLRKVWGCIYGLYIRDAVVVEIHYHARVSRNVASGNPCDV